MISKGELIDIYFNKENVDLTRYPFSLPFFRNFDVFKIHPKVTYFIGENGTGKSTLLEAIAVASGFNPEGGSFNFNFAPGNRIPNCTAICVLQGAPTGVRMATFYVVKVFLTWPVKLNIWMRNPEGLK